MPLIFEPMAGMRDLVREIHRRSLWQVLSIYLVGGWVAYTIVQSLTEGLDLPDWFPAFAIVLLIIGLPIVLATAFIQEGVPKGAAAPMDEDSHAPDDSDRVDASPAASAPPGGALFTWRFAITGGVLAFALWGMVAAGWLLWLRPRPLTGAVAAGAEVIAVVPFSVAGTAELTGEGMADLLAASLDQVGPIRTIAPQTVLARWEQVADEGRPDLTASLEVGRLVEAGSVLSGSIVTAGSDVRINATLHTVSGAQQLARAQVSGKEEALLTLVDSLSVALLREIWRSQQPVPNLRVSAISTGDVDAIRAYLEGVAVYRRRDYPAAVEALTRAVTLDSTFALAHLVLTQTYGWPLAFPSSTTELWRRRVLHAEAAARHADRLPDRESSLIDIEMLLIAGNRTVALDSLEAFLQRYPEDTGGWYRMGDVRFHAFEGFLMEGTELMAPFERVVELDPTARTLYGHLPAMIMAYADSSAYGRFLDAMEGIRDPSVPDLQALEGALWGASSPGEAVRILGRLPQGFGLLEVVFALAFRRGHSPGAVADALDELAEELPPRSLLQPALDEARERLRSALGQLSEARRLRADLAPRTSTRVNYELAARPVLAGFAGTDLLPPVPGRGPTAMAPHRRYLWLALVALNSGESELARQHIEEGLSQVPDFERLNFELLYGATRGWADLVEGDTLGGLRVMETALSGPRPSALMDPIQSMGPELNVLVFRLAAGLASRPETRDRGLRLLSMPWVLSQEYEVLRRLHEGRALEASGDAEGARAAYGWFVDALSQADPGLPVQKLVEEARTALERLGG